MTDSFQLLGQPRQPWLDEASLQAAFLERSRQCHPDRFHQAPAEERQAAHDRYVALNTAHQELREPRARLVHLLRLETGQEPPDVQEIPHETTDLFMRVGAACREADQFLKNHQDHTTAILKAQRLMKAQPVMARLQETMIALGEWQSGLVDQLESLNTDWNDPDTDRPLVLRRLEQLYRLFSYQDRWSRQIRERMFQITAP